MIDHIITQSGHRLAVGRIHRREIDRFAIKIPRPEPPTKTAAEMGIEVFGGTEEEELLLDYNDPEYIKAAKAYNLSFWDDRLDHIAPALDLESDLTEDDKAEIAALEEIGYELDKVTLLRMVILKSELDAVTAVEAVKYNSTVTIYGIRKAVERYGVRWKDRPVPIEIKDSALWTNNEFADRRSAQYCGYNWDEFCQLTGPEQSSLAAFHRLNLRLHNLRA